MQASFLQTVQDSRVNLTEWCMQLAGSLNWIANFVVAVQCYCYCFCLPELTPATGVVLYLLKVCQHAAYGPTKQLLADSASQIVPCKLLLCCMDTMLIH